MQSALSLSCDTNLIITFTKKIYVTRKRYTLPKVYILVKVIKLGRIFILALFPFFVNSFSIFI